MEKIIEFIKCFVLSLNPIHEVIVPIASAIIGGVLGAIIVNAIR